MAVQTLPLRAFLALMLIASPGIVTGTPDPDDGLIADAHRVAPEHGLAGLDALAFNEMVLGSQGRALQWAEAPGLVILMSVIQYQVGDSRTYHATSERLTEAEADQLADDLTGALTMMTGGRFTSFASVRREFVETHAVTQVLRPGQIVVGRFRGVAAHANTLGLGGRTVRANGTITSGALLLDCDFDRASDRRRLLRTHELGHALGFNHVEAQSSIMNARIGTDVTEFDRRAAAVISRRAAAVVQRPALFASAK
jgi:hypothetical protein